MPAGGLPLAPRPVAGALRCGLVIVKRSGHQERLRSPFSSTSLSTSQRAPRRPAGSAKNASGAFRTAGTGCATVGSVTLGRKTRFSTHRYTGAWPEQVRMTAPSRARRQHLRFRDAATRLARQARIVDRRKRGSVVTSWSSHGGSSTGCASCLSSARTMPASALSSRSKRTT